MPETGGIEISELSAGEVDEEEEDKKQQSSISQDDTQIKTVPSGEDSTSSDSSFEQLDPPSN